MLTIEAMKMETGLYADRAGTVKALHVQPGAQVDAKDLLVELEGPDGLTGTAERGCFAMGLRQHSGMVNGCDGAEDADA